MNQDRQKKSVEYRNAPSRSRVRSMQAHKVKARAKNRKRNLVLFYLSVFVVIVVAAITLSLTVLFNISTIEVFGTSRYTVEQIIQESGVSEGSNLFLMNKSAAVQNIRKNLPYIGQVKITRKLPGTVQITVEDAKIAGVAAYQNGYLVLDRDGKAVEQLDELPQDYAQILGLDLSSVTIGSVVTYSNQMQEMAYTSLLAALEESGLDCITKLDLTDTASVTVEYDGRVRVNFGLPTDLIYKARFAKRIFDDGKIQSTEQGVLDLSVVTDNNKAYFRPEYTTSSAQEIS